MSRNVRRLFVLLVVTSICSSWAPRADAQIKARVPIRGRVQTVSIYGRRGDPPVIVSSGDGGWMHLGPHVAAFLASRGYFVVGFDTRAYLESFTSGTVTLREDEVPGDYKVLADFAAEGSTERPLLIGVSVGAGLSVLAATDARTRASIAGVVALGLPDANELGWRWRDAVIYVTHGVPKEPTFSAAGVVERVSPAPLAAIHSTQDEFVPLAEIRRVIDRAREPKKLWVVAGSNHRFSGNLTELNRRLLEAIAWVRENSAR